MPQAKSFAAAENQLHDEAIEMTGLTDFGERDYFVGLKVLLTALDANPNLTEAGRDFAWRLIRASLVSRLHAAQGWKDNPGCLENTIARPLIIIGIPRTGTTALHKLLSVDSQFQGLERWLTHYPMPRPPTDTWHGNPHFQAAVDHIAGFQGAQPKMKAAHNIVAEEVDECIEVLRHSFTSNIWGSVFRVPPYDAWWKAQDERVAYHYYADVLRLIGSQEPDKQWLLKNPGHLWQMHNLLNLFPDACMVVTHRDPVKAIPSLCSLMEMAHTVTEGAAADPRHAGPREEALWSEATRRALEVRASHEDQFHDVYHQAFHADPMGVVRGIYEKFGLTLTDETRTKMAARIQSKPELSHGVHSYEIDRFGLEHDHIRTTFKDYIARFSL